MNIIEAMKRALEALESCDDGDYSTGHVIYPSFNDKKVDSAIVTLSAAIEELEKAEPVAWMGSNSNENGIRYLDFIIPADWLSIDVVPLYAHPSEDKKDAERYRMLRRGQHWSVIDGIGDTLIADGLDAAIDATMLKTPNVQIEPPSRLFAKVRSTVGLGLDAGQGNGD